jgi:hypothetical protein
MHKRALEIADDPILPVTDVNDILDAVGTLGGQRVVDQLKAALGREGCTFRTCVLDWLLEHEPHIYGAMDGIVRGFHSAHLIASETRDTIVMLNHGLLLAKEDNHKLQQRILLLEAQVAMRSEAPAEEPSAEEKPAKKKRGRKKNPETPATPPDDSQAKQDAFVAEAESKALRSKDPYKPESHYTKIEPWSDMFHVEDWVNYHRKGSTRMALETLKDYGTWKSLYHVGGPWPAEQLVELLETEGYEAVAIKRRRGTSDQEPFNYKVVSTKPL